MEEVTRGSVLQRCVILCVVVIVQLITSCQSSLHIKTENHTLLKYMDIQAGFGSPILMTNYVRGVSVKASPSNACKTMEQAPTETKGHAFAIAVKSSDCHDDMKAYNAQIANFEGLIIYDPDSVKPAAPHRNPKSDYEIIVFVIGVGRDAGENLIRYDYKTTSTIVIYGNIYIPLEWYLLPFITIVGVCLLLMLLFLLFKFLRDRRRINKSRLSKDNLKKIPIKKYKKGDEYDLCAICLDEYEDGDKLRLLPCSHAYHCKCVDPWLTNNKRVCPICKRRVAPSGKNQSDSEESQDSDEEESPNTERTPLLAGTSNRLTVSVESTRAVGTIVTHSVPTRPTDAIVNSV